MAERNGERPAARGGRVLVAFGIAALDEPSLETAAVLAERRGAELAALLVADPALAALTGLPFATEIDRLSAAARRLDAMQWERSLRACRRTMDAMLRNLAGLRRLSTSVKLVEGEVLRAALDSAAAADLLLLGPLRPRPPGSLRRRRPVAAVVERGARDAGVFAVAAELALTAGVPLTAVLAGADEDAREHRTREELLGSLGLDRSARWSTAADIPAALEAAASAGSGLICVSRRFHAEIFGVARSFLERPDRVLVLAP